MDIIYKIFVGVALIFLPDVNKIDLLNFLDK